MAQTLLKGNPINTNADLPQLGSLAVAFQLTANTLNDMKLSDFSGKKIVLNIFPSIDTPVCATSVRTFNMEASKLSNTVVLCISRDLPFALGRFCGAEGITNVTTLSEMRNHEFGDAYGLSIIDGPMAGLLARAVIILDESGKVIYTELVDDIVHEPNYEAALRALV
ncbi:MAG: thiol peroxidase [Candidatus Cloacimonetes bacterium HGW-Cloacimonetes-1]|jgi:thiol peroxidase|nr:MAG: thiol peroxidase [Candidatus Cloacimonetes bacterium HGW-Cloacimonetes-1]